jgi:hypothetical protein
MLLKYRLIESARQMLSGIAAGPPPAPAPQESRCTLAKADRFLTSVSDRPKSRLLSPSIFQLPLVWTWLTSFFW